MPPRKKAASAAASKPAAKADVAKKPGGAGSNGGKKKRAGPYKMPPPLPKGAILTDLRKNKWCLGSSVGKGGFGEIYTACPSGKSIDGAKYVIKIVSQCTVVLKLSYTCVHVHVHGRPGWLLIHMGLDYYRNLMRMDHFSLNSPSIPALPNLNEVSRALCNVHT